MVSTTSVGKCKFNTNQFTSLKSPSILLEIKLDMGWISYMFIGSLNFKAIIQSSKHQILWCIIHTYSIVQTTWSLLGESKSLGLTIIQKVHWNVQLVFIF